MTNWEIYVRESYELIRRAECELTVNLPHEIEAYLVHLFAGFLDKPQVNTEPVCLKLFESTHKPLPNRKDIYKQVGDECLLIHSMGWGKSRWPSKDYYANLGQVAYTNRAFVEMPPDELFDELSLSFDLASKILRKCKI